MQVAFPILNAYLLPGVDAKQVLYPSISPVNSFRQLLNTYFGTQLDLVPDESYYTTQKNGEMQFLDACQEYQYCPKK